MSTSLVTQKIAFARLCVLAFTCLQANRTSAQLLDMRDTAEMAVNKPYTDLDVPVLELAYGEPAGGQLLDDLNPPASGASGPQLVPQFENELTLDEDLEEVSGSSDIAWTKGEWKIVPFGRLRGEAIYSTAPTTGDAVIVFLNPRNLGVDEDVATIHGKQSQINFAITGPNMGQWQTGGVILTNFMGATPLRNVSGANIVLAFGEVKNEEWRFAFGRQLDLFGPINPTTVNGINQRGAGNIGIYRGALNLDRYVTFSNIHKWTLSGRISQQDVSDYSTVPQVQGKDNGWPNIESRVGVELGPEYDYGRPIVVGVSGVIGEVQAVASQTFLDGLFVPAADAIAQTRGIALDVQLQGPRCGVRGEAWWGRAAGTYFVATLQSLNPETAQAIESIGGWAEVYYNCNRCVTMHVGYGVDDPNNNDLGVINPDVGIGQISFNDVGWWNIIYNVTDYFELAFEVSHRRTRYLDPAAANEGTVFHFASTLTF